MNVRSILSVFAFASTAAISLGGCISEQATDADRATTSTSDAEALKAKKCGGHTCSKNEVCNPGGDCAPHTGPGTKHKCQPLPPACEPAPTGCDAVKCASGTHCEEVPVECIKAPCPAIAECVKNSPCDTVKCAAGTQCVEHAVECLVAPCPVIAKCDPICDNSDPTRHHVANSPQQCQLVKFACSTTQVQFFDACGCGCQDICPVGKCGPKPGIANTECADGSEAGPTGNCLKHADGTCGWEILTCP